VRSDRAGNLVVRRVLLTIWALVPAVTFGWGAPFTFTYAAIRLRSARLGVMAALYGVVAVVSFFLVGVTNSDTAWQGNVGTAMALVEAGVATAHAFVLRARLLRLPSLDQEALDDATSRIRLRERARHVVATNPGLANELRIGRPDLPRQFDDGGLIDANHAPLSVLESVPGITSEIGDQIVAVRDGIGGFDSLDDLSITLNLPPQALDHAADFLVFLR